MASHVEKGSERDEEKEETLQFHCDRCSSFTLNASYITLAASVYDTSIWPTIDDLIWQGWRSAEITAFWLMYRPPNGTRKEWGDASKELLAQETDRELKYVVCSACPVPANQLAAKDSRPPWTALPTTPYLFVFS